MDLRTRFGIGCLGALAPILASLLVVDFRTSLADVQLLDGLTYVARVVGLCGAACLVVFLNSDEERPVKLFQLGIAAPAILTTLINGANVNSKKASIEFPSAISIALAQPASLPNSAKDCAVPQELTSKDRILKGLLGIIPDNNWYVVVGSYGTVESAIVAAEQLQRRYQGRFLVSVCAPVGGGDERYRVVVGENQSYADASKLRLSAIRGGFSNDLWVWNPVEMSKSIQK